MTAGAGIPVRRPGEHAVAFCAANEIKRGDYAVSELLD